MPRLPRLNSRETIRALERLGFVQLRQRGSHIVLRRDGQTCVVPTGRDLRLGTLAGILDQAGVSVEDFIEAAK
jgi:predicted RNA binding protein YcfA (HicA-like mRNA interferase family)